MSRISGLAMNLSSAPNYTLRLSGLRPVTIGSASPVAGQLERNHQTRSDGYESGDLVQPDLTRTRPQIRTLVQHAG